VGRKPDQEGAELATLAIAEWPEQLVLGAPGRLARSLHCPPPVRRQLDAVTSSVGRIRGAGQKPPVLELVQEGDQVAGLDPKLEGQVTLRDRTLRVQMVQNRELGPSQPALAEAAAQAPGGGAGEAKDQDSEPGDERCVSCLGLRLGRCLDWVHVRYITYIS